MRCPVCNHQMKLITVKKHIAKMHGIKFPVENATFWICNNCGEKVYSGKELKRWEKIFKEYLTIK